MKETIFQPYVYQDINQQSMASVAVSAPEERLEHNFDCERTIKCLDRAIRALQSGDGSKATQLTSEAFARLALFHRYR